MKRYSIDGLPGYTMQGKKGNTGERGCMTFCNVMNTYNITKNYNYSIGIFIDENDVMTPIVFPSNKVMPIKGDYVIDVLQSISNLYVIDNIIDFSKENLLNESSGSDDSGLAEDELFRTNVINAIYDSVEGFEEFVKSLTDDDVYYVFILSFINSWTFRQGISSKDMDFSVAMQSFPIYRKPWKGEYTPKYLSKEITYVSSPYTPFAHVKTKNLVEDNQASLQKLPQGEQVEGGLFATWPGVYRNIANLASYYTDIFEFDINAFGYVFKKDKESGLNINPWLNITDCAAGDSYENIDMVPCFSAVVNKNGSYTPKDGNIFELLSVTNINDAEKEIIKILNNEKAKENVNSSDYQKAENVKSFIGDKVLLIQKDRSAGKNTSADNHYLSFLKVNLYSSTKINSDEEENNDSIENNESINQYEDTKTTQSKCVINTKKVDMKSDGTLAQYKITYVGDDIEFLHDPNTIGSTKKINATIFLGKNHFNLNQVNVANDKVINTSYHCKNISHENTGNKDSYTFSDYEINVYDVNKMEINSFVRSDEAQMKLRDFRINNVTAPVLQFKEWDFCFVSNGISASQASCSQRRSQQLSTTRTISGNKYSFKYLDFLFNGNSHVISNFSSYINTPVDHTDYEFFGLNGNTGNISNEDNEDTGDLNTNYLLFSIETKVIERNENNIDYNEYQVVKFPLTLNNLYIGFHIIKLDNGGSYTTNTTQIQVGNINYTQIPYIENKNETEFSIISKKLYSLGNFNDNNQDVNDLEEQPLISLETVNNNRQVNTHIITSNLGKLDADYYIVPCLYAKICSKIKIKNGENETITYEYNDETSSLKLICESDKIFSVKDLYLLFAQEENVDIPFEFLCNINTFTNARYYIGDFKLCIPNDMMVDDSVSNITINETRAFMETPSEDTGESESAFTKNISYTNITQCIKVNNLETDETGSINIPIISTKPTIHTNNSKNDKEEENVFAYIVIEYSNNSLMDKAYLEYPFFASRTIIDKIFFSQNTHSLNCYLLPRKFYLNNKNITNITGASFDQSNTELDYIIYQEASNYYWNEYITQSDLINDRTSFAESSGEIPLGGLFKVINGNILYYDSNDPTLQESSQRFKKYNILTNTFDDYEEGEEYDKEDPENKIDNVEELIDYHEALDVEAENYALTQFVVYSSLKPELLKNVKIEIELFNNTNMNIKNVCTCVDNMWETTKYTDSLKFNYNNDTIYYLPRKHMLDIMQDLYMGAVHNAPSVITEKTGNYPYINVNTVGYKNNSLIGSWQSSLIHHKHDEYIVKYNGKDSANSANRLKSFYNELNSYGNENILKYAYTSKTDEISEITQDTEFIYSRVGWSKNYDNTLNFDKENIFPCTLVIKDYNNKTENGTYASSIMIPKELADNCSMKIYAYIKSSSSSATKILIGETSMDKTY